MRRCWKYVVVKVEMNSTRVVSRHDSEKSAARALRRINGAASSDETGCYVYPVGWNDRLARFSFRPNVGDKVMIVGRAVFGY